MSTQRKQYSADFKARVVLESLKGLKTIIVDGYVGTWTVLPLQPPPHHKEQQQGMLHHRKSHIGI